MELKAFTAEVNGVAKAHAAKLSAKFKAGKAMFGATHFDYPEEMMEYYHQRGITPEQAFAEIQADK